MTTLFLAIPLIVSIFGFLFVCDPISFGFRCCELTFRIVSLGLNQRAKTDWDDEWIGQLEEDVWDLKKFSPDSAAGRFLIIQAMDMALNGWSDRSHYTATSGAEHGGKERNFLRRLVTLVPRARFMVLSKLFMTLFTLLTVFLIVVNELTPAYSELRTLPLGRWLLPAFGAFSIAYFWLFRYLMMRWSAHKVPGGGLHG